jgi:flagellar motor switch/type III secretory pathway protein FliN
MTELTAALAESISAACQRGAAEAAAVLGRALDQQGLQLVPAEPSALDLTALGEEFGGPGLVIVLQAGDKGALLLLPESSGLLPNWYAAPDATGESKLDTLAQELGMLLLPEEAPAEKFRAISAEKLADVLEKGGVEAEAQYVPLGLTAGDKQTALHMIWPVARPEAVFAQPEPSPAADPAPASPAPPAAPPREAEEDDPFAHLPPYTRSMLRIKVPGMVTWASKKQSIQNIVELGAGSIIKFDKSCDEMLELEVGGHVIAEGEAVKVGDKFGLRLSSMVLPGERFDKLAPRRGTPPGHSATRPLSL